MIGIYAQFNYVSGKLYVGARNELFKSFKKSLAPYRSQSNRRQVAALNSYGLNNFKNPAQLGSHISQSKTKLDVWRISWLIWRMRKLRSSFLILRLRRSSLERAPVRSFSHTITDAMKKYWMRTKGPGSLEGNLIATEKLHRSFC